MWVSVLLWACGALALVLVSIGLFWDRPGWRGRPSLRCRKCWFDLTRARDLAHVSRQSPVVCPECGREHPSLRAMMRTRRRKRFVTGAAVVLVLMYTVRVAPAVRARGWIAAVPGVCLVAMVPFFSGAEGSSDRYVPDAQFHTAHSGPAGGIGEVALDEMIVRLRGQGAGSSLGRASRRLLFLLGRLQSPEALTDPLTLRGTAFRECVSAWIQMGLIFRFERDWARRQVCVSVTPGVPVYEGGQVYGQVRARTLGGEEAWLWSSYHARFCIPQRVTRASFGGTYPFDGPGRTTAQARERHRYDWTRRVDENGYPLQEDYPAELNPLGYLRAETNGDYSVKFDAHIAWNEVDRFQFTRLGLLNVSVVVPIPAEQVRPLPSATQSPQIESWIRSRVQPELFLDYDEAEERFRPALRFNLINAEFDKRIKEGVIFGGRVEVRATEGDSAAGPTAPIATLGPGVRYWLVEAARDPESVDDWHFPSIRSGVAVDRSSNWLKPSYGVDNRRNESNALIVRVTGDSIGLRSIPDLKGLFGADTIYNGDLEVPIPNWTPDEFRRFITSGYMPDHAMD